MANRMLSRRTIGIFILLLVVYVATRLPFLTRIPIFTDEAIYIRWGQIALQDSAQRFISLEDGKQPLFIWLMLPFLKFVSDPLVAGRLVSVSAGLLTLVGLMGLGWKLFGKRTAFFTGLAYIVSPFFLLYDRLALYDSLTTATMVWSLLFSVLLVEMLRFDVALLFGMVVGTGLLTKSSAQFSLILLPTMLLVKKKWSSTHWKLELLRWAAFALVAAILAFLIQSILRLAPLYHMIGLKNLTFIVTWQEFLAQPFTRVFGNLGGLTHWATAYATPPYLLLLFVGVTFGLLKNWKRTVSIISWFLIPYVALAVFGKVLYPRYLLFMVAPLVLLIGKGMEVVINGIQMRFPRPAAGLGMTKSVIARSLRRGNLASLFLVSCFLFLVLAYPSYVSYLLVADPVQAPIPSADRNQLFDDWPSGYGIPEVVLYLREQGKSQDIFVGTEGTFGLTPSALEIYLKDEKRIKIRGYWPIRNGMAEIVGIANAGKPTFLLLKDTQIPESGWPVELIARYKKGKGNVYMGFYKVLPRK